jgi:hypothetical protein
VALLQMDHQPMETELLQIPSTGLALLHRTSGSLAIVPYVGSANVSSPNKKLTKKTPKKASKAARWLPPTKQKLSKIKESIKARLKRGTREGKRAADSKEEEEEEEAEPPEQKEQDDDDEPRRSPRKKPRNMD